MSNDFIELKVLTPEITGYLCSEKCGSKCCNFSLSDHYVPIKIIDYANLKSLGLSKFVTFHPSVELPQLVSKASGDCVFLNSKTRLCMIYEFRPYACRVYPYGDGDEEEEEGIPKWCELYYRSSDELKEKRLQLGEILKNRYAEHQSDVDHESLMEYLELERSNVIYQTPHFEIDKEIKSDRYYWRIQLLEEEFLKKVEKFIENLKNQDFVFDLNVEFDQDDFVEFNLFNILIYNHDFQIIGHLGGLQRQNESIIVPYINDFPPDFEGFDRLYRIISSADDYRKKMIRGAILPDKMENLLSNAKNDAKPINLEYP